MIRRIASRLTYRKVPFLVLYELALVTYLYFSPNPYQKNELLSNAWFFELGFLFLIPLAFLEKRKGLPLPYAEPMSKYNYFVAGGIGFIGMMFIVRICVLLMSYGLFPYGLSPFDPANWFTVAWGCQAGVMEESLKIGLTNLLGVPALRMRQAKARTIWVFFAGTISVFTWAYVHILTASFTFGEFLMACLVGLVLFTITLWKRNYLPAVVVHGIYDVGATLGYWV